MCQFTFFSLQNEMADNVINRYSYLSNSILCIIPKKQHIRLIMHNTYSLYIIAPRDRCGYLSNSYSVLFQKNPTTKVIFANYMLCIVSIKSTYVIICPIYTMYYSKRLTDKVITTKFVVTTRFFDKSSEVILENSFHKILPHDCS